jgi:predicted ArsR family transcriptional regulator
MKNIDNEIMKLFRKAGKLGRKQITADAIALNLGQPTKKINQKLNNLSKYGYVKISKRKKVNIWEMP